MEQQNQEKGSYSQERPKAREDIDIRHAKILDAIESVGAPSGWEWIKEVARTHQLMLRSLEDSLYKDTVSLTGRINVLIEAIDKANEGLTLALNGHREALNQASRSATYWARCLVFVTCWLVLATLVLAYATFKLAKMS